jgi:hypothetical protein
MGPWLGLLTLAIALYFFGLGSFYAPTNGDEMVYIHIARLTAESGHWLPLVSDLDQMRNTKPPLLFWQALVAGTVLEDAASRACQFDVTAAVPGSSGASGAEKMAATSASPSKP